MEQGKIVFTTTGTQCSAFQYEENGKHTVLFEGGSLRDATEAMEFKVLQLQYKNRVGNFNPDGTISAMVTNMDIRAKMQKIIDTQGR